MAQTLMAAAARRNLAKGAAPIQTGGDANRNARFSYQETPVEIQRATFEPFSSPTNSTIDESPVSPASPSRALPAYPYGPPGSEQNPLPLEKSQLESPQEVHPAFFAPYSPDPAGMQQQQAQEPAADRTPQSPTPIPTKKQEAPPQPTPVPVTSTFDPPPTSAIERRGTYNPDSLAGPNGAPVENHRPGQVSHPNASVDPHWRHGLCEPDALCCMGAVCPCMIYGKTMYRLSRKAQKQDPTDLLGYESCNGSCGLFAAACGFQWVLAAITRTRIRKSYHLEGSFGTDCVKALCCCCCVVMQNEREVRDREELIQRHAGLATGAYIAPGTMTYAPPPR